MRRAILISCLLAPIAVVAGWLWVGAWALLLLLPPAALYLWATLRRSCEWWGPVLTSFPTRHREVLLTFDDGPDPVETPLVLNLLDTEGAKGLFFITGARACEHPELVQEITARGHGIGVQTMNYDPATFWRLSPTALELEISHCVTALRRILPEGYELRWFRPPGGRRNHWLDPIVAHQGLTLMGCSARDGGKKLLDFDATVIRLRRDIDSGGLVCLHHGQTDETGERTLVPLVEELLLWLRGQGYKLGEETPSSH